MNGTTASLPAWLGILAFAAAGVLSHGAIRLLWPWLVRYALARQNARSSHSRPTPQGGGIAVVGATLVVVIAVFTARTGWTAGDSTQLAAVVSASLLLAVTGAVDDIHPIHPLPRLGLQMAAVALVIACLPADLRVLSWLPWWPERAALLVAGLWFVNLVNFMDGIDWLTVAETVPVTGGLVLLGLFGALPPLGIATALALAGAIIGFAPFNRPVARLFLGDVGSVPIGLILAWLLALVAGAGHLAAAILLPLYYVADATITVLRRLVRGEKIWQAHRTHFYQQATSRGFSVSAVVARVFLVNLGLVVLAVATLWQASLAMQATALVLGCALVGWLLRVFARGRQ